MNRRSGALRRRRVVLLAVVVSSTAAAALAACGGSDPAPSGAASAHESRAPLGAGHQKLDAGTHVLDLLARDQEGTGPAHLPRLAVTVPDGWFNFDGWGLSKGRELPFAIAVSFWDVDQVYPTPCKWKYKPMIDPGPGVDGLASALARQPLRNATATTGAILGGVRGKYLQWSVPTDIAFDQSREAEALFPECDEDTFQSWTARGWAGDRYQQAPGQVDRIWIVNVDGERLVVDAFYLPQATAADRAELEEVVNSIRFLG